MTATEAPPARPAANALRPGRASPDRPKPSVEKGDVPPALLERYLIGRDRRGRPEHFYRDQRTAEPAFRDRGRRLETGQAYPDTIADMLKVAEHRGWRRLRVDGEEGFRRDVWIQARARGLEVDGYRPRDRDRQAAGEPARDLGRETALQRRLDRAAVVVRRIVPDVALAQKLLSDALARARSRAMEESRPSERRRSR